MESYSNPATDLPVIGTLRLSESACSPDLTQSPVSSGTLALNVVNETTTNSVLDSWQLDEGYSYEQLVEFVDGERSLRESGQFNPNPPSELGVLRRFNIDAGKPETVSRLYRHRHIRDCLLPARCSFVF